MILEKIFENIHNNGLWLEGDSDKETSCGKGSKIINNQVLLKKIPFILEKYSIKEIIDVGCGDINWISSLFKYFFDNNISYTGIDVSKTIIEKALSKKELYGNVKLQVGNIIDIIPDNVNKILIISKDVLVHLSNEIIKQELALFKERAEFLLTTNFPENGNNKDIEIGKWRPIKLNGTPFNLGEPIEIIPNYDQFTKNIFPDKNMSLFKLK